MVALASGPRAFAAAEVRYTARMDRQLIIEHIPRLRRYARALVGDRYIADDLVQDTLERAWNKFYLWRAGSDLRAWLFTIMHNVFVNQARRRRYEIEQPMEEPPAVPVRATQSDHLELQDVDRALRTLSIEQREVVLLVAVEQLTYEEVSRALGIPIGTVMSRLSRARERLRQILGGQTVVPLKVVK
jgi:RNA polymerase sigma-70 factor, ECF subfamily